MDSPFLIRFIAESKRNRGVAQRAGQSKSQGFLQGAALAGAGHDRRFSIPESERICGREIGNECEVNQGKKSLRRHRVQPENAMWWAPRLRGDYRPAGGIRMAKRRVRGVEWRVLHSQTVSTSGQSVLNA
jgi:hypothetical protein